MLKQETILKIYCDGGARGNPGPAGIGFIVKNHLSRILHAHSEFIGPATNNVAEYQAVIAALKWLVKQQTNRQIPTRSLARPVVNCQFFLDSALVVNQLNGKFKVKHPVIRDLFATAAHLKQQCGFPIVFVAIPRQQNTEADALVNQALDRRPLRFYPHS